MLTIYLAGPLFSAGDRLHNLHLEKHLKALGYDVILPQREALKFCDGGRFDLSEIARDCARSCRDKNNIFVGNTDGTDTDSGTAAEFGIAITATGRAVTFRTDFRTVTDREIGLNTMLTIDFSEFIYFPCGLSSLNEVDLFYNELAQKIHEAIGSVLTRKAVSDRSQ